MLVNSAQSEPILDWLKRRFTNESIYNFITGEYENAWDLINWKRCYTWNVLKLNECRKDLTLPFATKSPFWGDVKEVKSYKKPIRKTEIVRYTWTEKEKVRHYKYVTNLKPVYKKRKIDGHYYLTTEFKKIKKRKYYYKIEDVLKYKDVKQKVTVGYNTYNSEKTKYVYKFKLYIAMFLIETYRFDGEELIHELRIEPYYAKRSFPIPFGDRRPDGTVLYSTPKDVYDMDYLEQVLDYANEELNSKKPKNHLEAMKYVYDNFESFNEIQKEHHLANYHFDERIREILFYFDYYTKDENTEITDVTNGQVSYYPIPKKQLNLNFNEYKGTL